MKYLLTCLLLFFQCALFAQQFYVAAFYEKKDDNTASKEGTKLVINYNEICALIKVETAQKGFVFDGGSIGVESVDDSRPDEIWIYVPAGLRSMTILHNKLGILRDYQFPFSLQPGHTYALKLMTTTDETIAKPQPLSQPETKPVAKTQPETKTQPAKSEPSIPTTQPVPAPQSYTPQWFVLTYQPAHASIEIDGVHIEGSDGKLSKLLSNGRHTLTASARRHHTITTVIDIETDKKEFSLRLKPAFGWLQVTGPDGASVFLDNEKIGTAPLITDTLESGLHSLAITKSNWAPYKSQIQILDDSIVSIFPDLQPNFTTVTLSSATDAEIWVNGVMKGTGNVSVDLAPGEYTFEARKSGHRSQSIVRFIELSSGVSFAIPAPVAVSGILSIDAKPIGAKVYVDGVYKGESPMLVNNLLIGQHVIKASYNGYSDSTLTVSVTEERMCEVSFALRKNQPAPVQSQPAQQPAPKQNNVPTPAPVQNQPAPVQSQPAPVQSQPAPVQSQPAPVQSQPAPKQNNVSTPAPAQSQPAQQPAPKQDNVSTPAPTQSQPAPAYSSAPASNSSKLNITYIQEDSTFSTTADGAYIENGVLNKVPAEFRGNYMTAENITGIKDWAFSGCTDLTGVTITKNVSYIGKYVFKGCPNLKTVNIADGVSRIGENTFQSCKALTSIVIPASISSISDRLFFDCISLRKVSLPNGLSTIGSSSFFGCEKLPSIVIPESVSAIGAKAFSGCNALTSVTIPANVQSIGQEAFSWCPNLNSVTFKGNVSQLAPDVFVRCKNLTTIYIPSGSMAHFQNKLPQEFWPKLIEK